MYNKKCCEKFVKRKIYGRRENIWKKIMIYHTEVYDEIYELIIHKKDSFFYAWNVIWKDSNVTGKFLIERILSIFVFQ